eukprot:1181694-Prorocentrum_minimum.AAC.8
MIPRQDVAVVTLLGLFFVVTNDCGKREHDCTTVEIPPPYPIKATVDEDVEVVSRVALHEEVVPGAE